MVLHLISLSLINGSTYAPTTAVSCLVTNSSSESLPNDGEKTNQPKVTLFPKWDYGPKISISEACILIV